MKTTFLFLLRLLCKLLAIILSLKAVNQIRRVKTKIHTLWISVEFKSLGKDSSICYPIVLHGGKYICIGNQTGLGKRGVLTAWDCIMGEHYKPEISIGDNTSIGEDYHITATNKIIIGNNVLMGKKITITDNSHGKTDIESLIFPPSKRRAFSKGPVTIMDNVWIGDKATILPGVTIGFNAIIGANAVVTTNIPANCVAAGIPAKIVKIIV